MFLYNSLKQSSWRFLCEVARAHEVSRENTVPPAKELVWIRAWWTARYAPTWTLAKATRTRNCTEYCSILISHRTCNDNPVGFGYARDQAINGYVDFLKNKEAALSGLDDIILAATDVEDIDHEVEAANEHNEKILYAVSRTEFWLQER
ncbi:hypothetical protein HPB51_014050 [Rhipicephalus microplus]|uniref:Uncharacterized protein n=1 Tax=Rhipicephalus microplus TaxID=6941 RepID=A0A9J6EA64_RHIMP|nr:hypothetical protein HPB51_014050 [Rhipicephalus microplus]